MRCLTVKPGVGLSYSVLFYWFQLLMRRPTVIFCLLCFRHLSESRFLLDVLHRSEFANFCHDLM